MKMENMVTKQRCYDCKHCCREERECRALRIINGTFKYKYPKLSDLQLFCYKDYMCDFFEFNVDEI